MTEIMNSSLSNDDRPTTWQIFVAYSSYRQSSVMTILGCVNFHRLFKDLGLSVRAQDLDLIFAKSKSRHERYISYEQFMTVSVPLLAQDFKTTPILFISAMRTAAKDAYIFCNVVHRFALQKLTAAKNTSEFSGFDLNHDSCVINPQKNRCFFGAEPKSLLKSSDNPEFGHHQTRPTMTSSSRIKEVQSTVDELLSTMPAVEDVEGVPEPLPQESRTLEDIFLAFSAFGRGNLADGMLGFNQFHKLCRAASLVEPTGALSPGIIDLIYAKSRSYGNKTKLTFTQFRDMALPSLAEKFHISTSALIYHILNQAKVHQVYENTFRRYTVSGMMQTHCVA